MLFCGKKSKTAGLFLISAGLIPKTDGLLSISALLSSKTAGFFQLNLYQYPVPHAGLLPIKGHSVRTMPTNNTFHVKWNLIHTKAIYKTISPIQKKFTPLNANMKGNEERFDCPITSINKQDYNPPKRE
ncbi:hypothetical protein [Rossellomorea sp. DUT-2]|uniref:hypothetical protein n=1 Tax=Rossellomorea sp. DUT-2 TaxID=3412021 RepID=UPI003D163D8F